MCSNWLRALCAHRAAVCAHGLWLAALAVLRAAVRRCAVRRRPGLCCAVPLAAGRARRLPLAARRSQTLGPPKPPCGRGPARIHMRSHKHTRDSRLATQAHKRVK